MVFVNQCFCIDKVCGRFPRVGIGAVAFPFNEVLEFAPVQSAIQDFVYFVFFFAFNFNRKWWGRFVTIVEVPRAESINVEYIVYF